MPKGFSNFKAFGTGFLGSINEDTEIQKRENYNLDYMKKQELMKLDISAEQEAQKEKYDTYKRNADFSQARDLIGQATNSATSQANQQPDQSQIIQAAQAEAPAQPNPQAQGGLNSPQGGNVPLSGGSLGQPSPQGPQNAPQMGQGAANNPAQPVTPMQGPSNAPVQDNAASSVANNKDDLVNATMTAFSKNYKAGEPIPMQVMAAKDILLKREKEGLDIQKEKDELADKNVDINSMGEDYKTHVQAMKNIGLVGKDTTHLHKLDAREEMARDKLTTDAMTMYQASQQATTSYNSLLHLSDSVITGPSDKLQAEVSAAVDKLFNDGKYSDAVNNWYIANKDTIQLANANARSLGNRLGYQSLVFEKNGVPSTGMPPEAMKQLLVQGLSTSRAVANQTKAIVSGPGQLSATQRQQMALKYAESNPSILSDGQTPNPEFKDFDTWIKEKASGKTTSSGVTAESVRNSYTKPQDTTGEDPNIAAIKQGLPPGAKVTKINK